MSDQGAGERGTDPRMTNGPKREHGIERILVALDSSLHSLAALEAGVRMAARLDAELLGLFVEDVNVRRLAALSFVEEVGFYTAECRQVETQQLSRQLRVQATKVRRLFSTTTRRLGLRCAFREIRGRVVSEVLSAASEVDLVALGTGAWSPFETERLAPAVQEVLSRALASVLVLRAGTRVESPMRVVYTGTQLAYKALVIAARLADDGRLVIFIPADDPSRAATWRMQAEAVLEGLGVEPVFRRLTEASVSRLAYLVAHEAAGAFVLPADPQAMADEALLQFLDRTRAPVMLVR